VDAFDNDLIAVETAEKNVAASGLTDTIRVLHASVGVEADPLQYDVITANIFADTIAELAPALVQHLKAYGVLIASGILVERAHLVTAAMEREALVSIETRQEDDWLVMMYRRGPLG
jgi:ribosomal protein L11 methyltransferase